MTVESRTILTLKRCDFEVSSSEVSTVHTYFYAVSRSPGIIRCGLSVHIAPIDTAMKQALLGVIAGYVAKKSKKKQKTLWTKSCLSRRPARGSYSMLFRELKRVIT